MQIREPKVRAIYSLKGSLSLSPCPSWNCITHVACSTTVIVPWVWALNIFLDPAGNRIGFLISACMWYAVGRQTEKMNNQKPYSIQ